MLTTNARKRLFQVQIGILLCGLPAVGFAKEPRRATTLAEEEAVEPVQSLGRRPVGAPQVLEIPSVQEPAVSPEPASLSEIPPSSDHASGVNGSANTGAQADPNASEPTAKRTYFGVLYASAEEGPVGVKVLDVIPGSPAERAGLEGVNAPRSQSSDLVKAALIVLTMSPVGPFALPLVIAHDMYMASQSPGDLIVAVGDQQVRDAVEFSQEMRRYHPGDTVTFSILRKGKPVRVPVQLEEEPS